MSPILAFIRARKIDAWLAGDREAFLDWEDAEREELTLTALYVVHTWFFDGFAALTP